MFKIILSLTFISLAFGQGPPPYYGLPLGAVYYSADGTQGEVYASDPNTLTIVNFYHKAKPGCTTFVAGPAKPAESLNVVATKDAIMLPVKYRKQTRTKRQAVKQSGIVWNAGPALGNFNNQAAVQSPKGEGIQWNDKAPPPPPPAQRGIIVNGVRIVSSVTPQTLPLVAGSGIRWGENGEEPEAPVYSRFSGPLPREPSEFIGGINIPDEQEDGKARFNSARTIPTTSVGPDIYGNDGVTLRLGLAGPPPPRAAQPEAPKPLAFGGLPPSAIRGGAPAGPAPPAPAAAAAAEAVVVGPKDEVRQELGGILILPAGSDRSDLFLPRNESKLLAKSNSSIAAQPVKAAEKEVAEKGKKPSEELRPELGGVILLPGNSSRSEFYQRNDSKIVKNIAANAPVVKEPQEQQAAETKAPNNHPWFPVEDPRRRTLPPLAPQDEQTKAPAKASSNSSHDWFPVEDPRDPRSKRPEIANLIAINAPLQEVNQESQQQLQNQQPLFVPVEDRKALFQAPIPSVASVPQDPVAAEINGAPKLPAAGDGLFYVLPEIKGEDLTVVLPQSYDITQFQWFGVYDHCKKQRTATVSIHGVRPPKETEVEGFKGWQHDVGSGKIHILNCNTMLISNFTYTGAGKTDAYLYVGNGDFPRGIIQKARAYIVGTLPDRILQNVHSEDILIRLPQGWKTLDISWISVYNPRDNISYGHALIPPVVAPPCDE